MAFYLTQNAGTLVPVITYVSFGTGTGLLDSRDEYAVRWDWNQPTQDRCRTFACLVFGCVGQNSTGN